jgi:CRP/FNR family cyclic AMP-dependent transcriptional regulator
LGRVPVFSTLEPDDLERIAQLAVPRSFSPGQAVFREGDSSDTCYVVHSGHARAVRQHGDGRIITLATFGPGDIFGELAMFEDERRSATVEALEQTGVVAVLGPDMRRLMVEHPQISTRLVIALGRRLRETNERLTRQSFQTVQSRVASVLGELVQQALIEGASDAPFSTGALGAPVSKGEGAPRAAGDDHVTDAPELGATTDSPAGASQRDVQVIATQADLAQLAGSSRESASRFLAVLERAGVISQGRGRLVVHDPQALQSYVF